MSFSALRFAGLDMMVVAWGCRICVRLASSGENRGEHKLREASFGGCANR
jgi:hypothetical protein